MTKVKDKWETKSVWALIYISFNCIERERFSSQNAHFVACILLTNYSGINSLIQAIGVVKVLLNFPVCVVNTHICVHTPNST